MSVLQRRPSNRWAGLGWAGLGWAGLGWAGLGWAGLGWAGLGWAGLGWAGLGWAGLGWAGLVPTPSVGVLRQSSKARNSDWPDSRYLVKIRLTVSRHSQLYH